MSQTSVHTKWNQWNQAAVSAGDLTEESVVLESVLPHQAGYTASTRGVPFAGGLKGVSMIISIGRGGESHMESSDPATERSAEQGHSGGHHMASEDTEAATATKSTSATVRTSQWSSPPLQSTQYMQLTRVPKYTYIPHTVKWSEDSITTGIIRLQLQVASCKLLQVHTVIYTGV